MKVIMKKLFFVFLLAGVSMIAQQPTQQISQSPEFKFVPEQQIKVRYTNYRGESAIRTIISLEGGIFWGHNEYHTHDQWLLRVWDVEKGAERIYALKDINEWYLV